MCLPGPKGIARDAKSTIECMNLLLDVTIIQNITTCTNICIRNIQQQFLRQRDAQETNERD